MIDEITIASNRGHPAVCKGCAKDIKQLEVRGVQKNATFNSYFCMKCAKLQLETANDKIIEMKEEFERLDKMNKKEREDYLQRVRLLKKL